MAPPVVTGLLPPQPLADGLAAPAGQPAGVVSDAGLTGQPAGVSPTGLTGQVPSGLSGLATVTVVNCVLVTEVLLVQSPSGCQVGTMMPVGLPVGLGHSPWGLPPGLPPVGFGQPSVMGHTVVLTAMTSVVTWPSLAGQLVTVGAQLVMVYVLVEYTVEVVQPVGHSVATGVEVAVTGQTVVETAMVRVTTWAGQLVTWGPHDVIVSVVVL